MSFETGLQAFKQNKFEPAIEALLAYCQECDDAGKVTSQKYMQAHMGIVKSYQALKQWEQAIAHCQTLAESANHPLTIWVDRTLPKLQKVAAKGDEPDTNAQADAKPKQDENLMLLQQGMAAYKKMQRDRAIKLLEEYVNVSTNVQSRNYMQAQMTLVKTYKETKALQKAITLCNQLTDSENFALKSWASKALPKLKKQLGEDASVTPSPSPSPQEDAPSVQTTEIPETAKTTQTERTDTAQNDSAAVTSTSSASNQTQSTQSGQSGQSGQSSSFTFDASPKAAASSTSSPTTSTRTANTTNSMNDGGTSPSRQTLARRSTTQRSPGSKRSHTTANRRSRQPAKSSKLVNNSIAHSGIGMVGGAFGAVIGNFILKRLVRGGIGLAFALIFFVFRGCFGAGSDITPLQEAVLEGNVETVKTLVAKGKSLEATDSQGNTALYWALVEDSCGVDTCEMSPQQQEIVTLLLDHGAQVVVTNQWQETPLHFAASVNGAQEILRSMLNQGANVNARDDVQMTPLHWAVTYGIDDNIEILLNRGADMNAKDADGNTPLDFAFTDGALKLLKSRGAVYGQEG